MSLCDCPGRSDSVPVVVNGVPCIGLERSPPLGAYPEAWWRYLGGLEAP